MRTKETERRLAKEHGKNDDSSLGDSSNSHFKSIKVKSASKAKSKLVTVELDGKK